ncbi:MAG: hypothetical protein BWY77_00646 [bacterium ADurb.Bin431]|nr:MAG: hypothetical protein BWY77_00646 [bacterium ADurb.Bin431]
MDEGPSDIVVADEPQLEFDPGAARIAHRRGVARIGHRDDDVRLRRALQGQILAQPAAYPVDVLVEDAAVGAGEIDELKDTGMARRQRSEAVRFDHPVMDLDQLAGLDIAYNFGAEKVEGAGLGGHKPAPLLVSQTERPHPVGIAGGIDAAVAHHHQGIGSLDLQQGLCYPCGHILRAGTGDQVQHHLGIGGGLKERALLFEPAAQFARIGEIAVMADGERPFAKIGHQRLGVDEMGSPGGGVTVVPDGHVAPQCGKEGLVAEDVGDEPAADVAVDAAAVTGDDAAALLPAVLLGIEGQISQTGGLRRAVDTNHRAVAARLVD